MCFYLFNIDRNMNVKEVSRPVYAIVIIMVAFSTLFPVFSQSNPDGELSNSVFDVKNRQQSKTWWMKGQMDDVFLQRKI